MRRAKGMEPRRYAMVTQATAAGTLTASPAMASGRFVIDHLTIGTSDFLPQSLVREALSRILF
jgi:hypothetical protein